MYLFWISFTKRCFHSFIERKNQKQSTENPDNKTDETKVISETDTDKDGNGPDVENANG